MANYTRRQVVAGGLGILASLGLAACGSGSSASTGSAAATTTASGLEKLTIGGSSTPHAVILEGLRSEFEAAGYDLDVVEYNDFVQPNVALADGSLDANFFQHQPYLDNYNEENGTDLKGVASVLYIAMSIFPGKTASFDEIQDGAQIAVPDDATNEARALLLLQTAGLIKLADDAGLAATTNDIVENPHNIEFLEVEAANVPRSLSDVDFAVINGNYVESAGLDVAEALLVEDKSSEAAQTYANVVAVRNGDEETAKTQAVCEILTSQACADFITENFDTTFPVF